MNTYIRIFIVLFLFSGSSCKDWLDVQPNLEATEGQIFSTAEGYRSVLNGLYKSMGSASLYGRELSFGMVDCISQQYRLDYGSGVNDLPAYVDAGSFKYQTPYASPIIESIWKKAFNVVANANNLIHNVQNTSPNLFEKGEMERKMILGEAYACRALMHFDMLRLFAPAKDDGQPYVPYVEQYPNIQANGIGVKPFLEKVIKDLENARDLVVEYDTSALGQSAIATADSRFTGEIEWDMEGYNDNSISMFYRARGFRLNYYSITALLARVYQYAERYDDAFACAEKVLKFQVKGEYMTYDLFTEVDFSGAKSSDWNTKKNLRIRSNLIFAVYNDKAYDDLELKLFFNLKKISATKMSWMVINKDRQGTFNSQKGTDETKNDYRYLYLVYFAQGKYPLSGKWYCSETVPTRDANVNILPVIRATEMRYIMAECYARKGNFPEAKRILEEARSAVGCNESLRVENWSDFETELIRDARREWISEGQLFYLYKRLNAAVDFGSNVVRPLTRPEYLLPIPSNQSF